MKKEILMLIIGILIGAILTTIVFLIIKGNTSNNMPNMSKISATNKENFNKQNIDSTESSSTESNSENLAE